MDKQFEKFFHDFVRQYSTEIFNNIPHCKSLLLDHAKGEYKPEIRLVLEALKLGCHTAILRSKDEDISLTRLSQAKRIRNEHFISEEIAASLIDLLLELRNDKYKPDTPVQKQTPPDTKPRSASMVEMAPIPAGTFLMGSPANEPGRYANETQHSVTLPNGFLMGKYPVTQGLYEKVMGRNPSCFKDSPARGEAQEKRPVEQVSWYDAIVFCNKLSILQGLSPVYTINGSTDPANWGAVPTSDNSTWDAVTVNWDANGYRLPTEAEWEYACRAGTTTAYHTGASISDNTGWYRENSGKMTHEVGKKTPNVWDVYDMHGNVWEWVWDWYGEYTGSATDPVGPSTGSLRVLRGGGWGSVAQDLRSALRGINYPFDRAYDLGFRVVRMNEHFGGYAE
jgi:formylglycine-generating enzyme required for sulfatase activity